MVNLIQWIYDSKKIKYWLIWIPQVLLYKVIEFIYGKFDYTFFNFHFNSILLWGIITLVVYVVVFCFDINAYIKLLEGKIKDGLSSDEQILFKKTSDNLVVFTNFVCGNPRRNKEFKKYLDELKDGNEHLEKYNGGEKE